MTDLSQETNKRTAAFRQQQRDATDTAFKEFAEREKREREVKTSELRKLREARASNLKA